MNKGGKTNEINPRVRRNPIQIWKTGNLKSSELSLKREREREMAPVLSSLYSQSLTLRSPPPLVPYYSSFTSLPQLQLKEGLY